MKGFLIIFRLNSLLGHVGANVEYSQKFSDLIKPYYQLHQPQC